ncbi:MAG: metal-dependent transcriptional regulator [Candidatus Thermoplasmatota archaeon]|nr:metal-dependent transcriptional regulator [Candidatus Thermoplasmatota archaeon]
MEDRYLTKRERDCIVLIGKNKEDPFPLRVSFIARGLNLKPPTVEEILRRLVNKDVIVKESGMVMFTPEGIKCYEEIMKKHRVMETFLTQCGVDPDEACEESSRFDYLLLKDSVDKINEKIGRPLKCPHGFMITG